MDIRNDFNNKITKSQQKWLDEFSEKNKGRILDVALTKAGYLAVVYARKSKVYLYGEIIMGRNAGIIESSFSKDYNCQTHKLIRKISISN